MVVFGLPIVHEDGALRACRASFGHEMAGIAWRGYARMVEEAAATASSRVGLRSVSGLPVRGASGSSSGFPPRQA
jgi:hypothetical protein